MMIQLTMHRIVVCLISVIVTIPRASQGISFCNEHCICDNATQSGICDGRGRKDVLQYIPEFPDGTSNITFMNNKLYNLTKETLGNISNLDVVFLYLNSNDICYIGNDTFSNLTHLQILDLSENTCMRIEDVAASLYSLPKDTIEQLELNHMLWHPYEKIFDGLTGTNITTIKLSHSYLTPFNGSWFQALDTLRTLDVSWNSIQDHNHNLTGLENLTTLDFIGNYINVIPNFTSYGLCNLETLYLSNTKLASIRDLKDHSQCLSKLYELSLNGISIPIIQSNVFSGLKSLKFLHMQKLSTQLKKIRNYAFNSSSLTNLAFSKCDAFNFIDREINNSFYPKDLFTYTPNLVYLNLSHNVIQLNSEAIKEMFVPLKKLKILALQFISLKKMPNNFFYQFENLEVIWMDYNLLHPWRRRSVFDGSKQLRELHLRNNQIGMIYSTSFPRSVLDSLKVLDLMDNQFICTCDLMWFRNWMKSTKVDIIGQDEYVCDFYTLLKDFNPTFTECQNVILIVTVSAGSGLGLFLIATITMYCCRWRIRFQLYKIRSSRRKYRKLRNQDRLPYAAYIVYCYEDLKWIKNELIPKLENTHGFKLCIPHRDFELGKVFADNIVDNMNMSKNVITVLSNNFSKNEWCLFQLAVARNKLSKDGTMSIYPIVLEEITFKNMNSALYTLIQLSNYAAWNNNEDAMELFWNQIVNNIK